MCVGPKGLNMYKRLLGLFFWIPFCGANAADSYRFLHVTIDTPWAIFIFLLFIVMFPFVLMAILYWYFALKSTSTPHENSEEFPLEK